MTLYFHYAYHGDVYATKQGSQQGDCKVQAMHANIKVAKYY